MTWQIELHYGEDNRLTRDLVEYAFKPALDIVEREWRQAWRAASQVKSEGANKTEENGATTDGQGALVIVGKRGQDKFFSNGKFVPARASPLISIVIGSNG